jgi:hypothetical protein
LHWSVSLVGINYVVLDEKMDSERQNGVSRAAQRLVDKSTIAWVMARRSVSPKGLGSGIRMIQFFMNRAGVRLPAARKRELERAKALLQARRAK